MMSVLRGSPVRGGDDGGAGLGGVGLGARPEGHEVNVGDGGHRGYTTRRWCAGAECRAGRMTTALLVDKTFVTRQEFSPLLPYIAPGAATCYTSTSTRLERASLVPSSTRHLLLVRRLRVPHPRRLRRRTPRRRRGLGFCLGILCRSPAGSAAGVFVLVLRRVLRRLEPLRTGGLDPVRSGHTGSGEEFLVRRRAQPPLL